MSGEIPKPAGADDAVSRPAIAVPRSGRGARICAAGVAVACGIVLGVAIKLKPDSRGFGTHQQMGAAPCGMIVKTGFPCPTCGMTTAFSHTVRGSWLSAMYAQPAGFVLALATVAGLLLSARMALTGRLPRALLDDRIVFRLFMALLVLLVAGWGFKLAVGFLDGTLPVRSVRL